MRRCLAAGLIAFALILAPAAGAQEAYDDVVTAEAETQEGLFSVHHVGDKLLFEIPDGVLGRDMIIMSRYAKAQEGLSGSGSNMAPNMVVRWERHGDRILLRAVSYQRTADEGSPVQMAVENTAYPAILHALPIEAEGDGTSVVDVTDVYLGDAPTFSLPRQTRQRLSVRRFDRDRSWLEWTRSFPTNVEVRVVQTYAADQPPSSARGGSLSFEVNHSMVMLPEEPMMPRLYDERTGLISMQVTDYSSEFQGVRPHRYLIRYRLEPSDPEAYARGEIVDPVKPWTWYIDPATPEWCGHQPRKRTRTFRCSMPATRWFATTRRWFVRPTPVPTWSTRAPAKRSGRI